MPKQTLIDQFRSLLDRSGLSAPCLTGWVVVVAAAGRLAMADGGVYEGEYQRDCMQGRGLTMI